MTASVIRFSGSGRDQRTASATSDQRQEAVTGMRSGPVVHGGLRVLCLSGTVPRKKAMTTLDLFDEVRAMTWRLLHP
jgi:hypothetical protein